MSNLSLSYYGIVCVSLAQLGLPLTVLEFRRMSPSKNPIDLTRQWEEEVVSTTTCEGYGGIGRAP